MPDRPPDLDPTVTGPPAVPDDGADGSEPHGFLARLDRLADSLAGSTPVPSSDPTAADFPTVPGFALHDILGEGGMGVVYLATDERLKMRVALKVMRLKPRPCVPPDDYRRAMEAARKRFASEAAILARLDHPNVVRVFAAGEVEGWPYYTMRHLPRGSLDDHRAAYRGTAGAVAGLMAKVARAVQHLHDNGIWHRDLKPQNVLLTDDGEPQVADFGIAKWLDGDDATPTQDGVRLGTYAYMAPEMVQLGTGGCGPAADVWAMGVMLYELLADRRPFPGSGHDPNLLFRIVKDAPLPLAGSKLPPGTDERLEAVALRALAKDPAHRYPSAAALADDLDDWLSGRRPDPSDPTATPLAELRRHAAPPAPAVSDTAPTVTADPVPAKPRRRWRATGWLAAGLLLAGVAVAVAALNEPPIAAVVARHGECVVVDENGKPLRKLTKIEGSQGDLEHNSQNRALTVSGAPLALYEITDRVPDLPFRLSAKVHHSWGDVGSRVGVYVRRIRRDAVGRLEHAVHAITADLVHTANERKGRIGHGVVWVDLGQQSALGVRRSDLFDRVVERHPANVAPFVELALEVRADGVTPVADGQPYPPTPWQTINAGFDSISRAAWSPDPSGPAGGGIGLILMRGTATVRDVRVIRLH